MSKKYNFKIGQKVIGYLIVGGSPIEGKINKKSNKWVIETKLAYYFLDAFAKIE